MSAKMGNKKLRVHWFASSTGYGFFAVKVLHKWRLIGKKPFILHETDYFTDLKEHAKNVLGFDYIGYL